VIHPSHPIAEGLPPNFDVPQSEMYGEPFDIPTFEELICCRGTKEGKYFAAGARFIVAVAAFSFSDLDTKLFRSTTTPMSIASSLTVSDGQGSPVPMAHLEQLAPQGTYSSVARLSSMVPTGPYQRL
jgi:hypothetical protein